MYADYVRVRDAKGVKDSDVSKATGIPQSTFSDWKKGKSKPKMAKLQLLANYFGCDVSEFGKVINEKMNIPKDLNSSGIIDVETQILLRNDMLHNLLLAGGKVVGEHPEVIKAMVYTLEKMGETK